MFKESGRVVIVRPYSDLANMKFDDIEGARSIDSNIAHSDGINLLVFVESKTNRIQGWADVPRRVIDFDFEGPSASVEVDGSEGLWDKALRAIRVK